MGWFSEYLDGSSVGHKNISAFITGLPGKASDTAKAENGHEQF